MLRKTSGGARQWDWRPAPSLGPQVTEVPVGGQLVPWTVRPRVLRHAQGTAFSFKFPRSLAEKRSKTKPILLLLVVGLLEENVNC